MTMNITDTSAASRSILKPKTCDRQPERLATTTAESIAGLTEKFRSDVDFLLGGVQASRPVDGRKNDKLTPIDLNTKTPAVAAPKCVTEFHSRSQDEDDIDELVKNIGGSISPILSDPICNSRRSSLTAESYRNATSFRLNYPKRHTCGSLFAHCSFSANTPATTIPIQSAAPATVESTERGQHLAVLLPSMKFSFSPTSDDISASSGIGASVNSGSTAPSSKWLSSGSFSLSTNTNTSVQLPHEDENFATLNDASKNTTLTLVKETYANSAHKTSGDFSLSAKSPRISTAATKELSCNSYSSSLPRIRRSPRTPKHFFQSYSHTDTDFVLTDENKNLSRDVIILPQQQNKTLSEAVITSRDAKFAYRQQKRSSSPNIGEYQTLDIAVHPDLIVEISSRHSASRIEQRKLTTIASAHAVNSITAEPTQQRRRCLQRSKKVKSGGSTSDSEPNDVRTAGNFTQAEDEISAIRATTPSTPDVVKKPTEKEAESLNAAQRYYAESGILGPINPSGNLIRKTSKILQESNAIEKMRKTSIILRASSVNRRKTSSTNCNSLTSANKTTTASSSPSVLETHNIPGIEMSTNGGYVQALNASKSQPPNSPSTIETTCGVSTNLTTVNAASNADRDALIKKLHGEMFSLKDVIKSRDAEIGKLRREIHKLKSVLQQTSNHIPIAHDELLQFLDENRSLHPNQCEDVSNRSRKSTTPRRVEKATCMFCHRKCDLNGQRSDSNGSASLDSISSELTPFNNRTCNDNGDGNSRSCTNTLHETTPLNTNPTSCEMVALTNKSPHDTVSAFGTNADHTSASAESLSCSALLKPKGVQTGAAPVLKKQGVSGESSETSMQLSINEPIPKFDKDFNSKQLIKDAIMENDFLKNIDASQVRELVESMYSISASEGEFVIREGDVGAHLYVSAAGNFEVVKGGKVLGIMGPGKAFGELAILYNCTRTASVRVLSDSRVWVLDRRVFQQIMMRTGMQRIENSLNFLKSVPLLKDLSEEVMAKIADVLEVEFYPAGTYIIRQGASGDTFFLISHGSVQVTQKHGVNMEKEIRTLNRGDYFGEQALINEDKRTANIIALAPGVECLTLDRESFTHLIGDLCELKEKNYDDESRIRAMKYSETKIFFGSLVKHAFPELKLTDLEVVTTLGIGGFGRVELVKTHQENNTEPHQTFALKCLKKSHIVDTKQEEHVFSERTIMMTCNTPFICRLYRTFRDEKYVYMLLEACMGGEIWTMLRDRGCFEETTTQFIIGCVLQAFEYLHSRGIIYRDLKPENLMMDERGYVKLIDFGFAKYIGNSSKTWTFCGTPEYVAPEIILNKGHDRAVDYWAVGILIHELLNGTPPFTSNDPMKTYKVILKGIDMIDFPNHMTRSAVQLVKKLCRDVPTERLGYQKGGIQDIKKHKWFLGFDWDGLQNQLLIPPFVRPIDHRLDTRYFDRFPCDSVQPPDELSGWDADF